MKSESTAVNTKLVLFDLDGVIIENGSEQSFKDSINILNEFVKGLSEKGIKFAVITGRRDDKLTKYLKENNIVTFTSSVNKVQDAENLMNESDVNFSEVFFIGDDILDIPLLQKVGKSAAPKNARREVKRVVDKVVLNDDLGSMLKNIKKLL